MAYEVTGTAWTCPSQIGLKMQKCADIATSMLYLVALLIFKRQVTFLCWMLAPQGTATLVHSKNYQWKSEKVTAGDLNLYLVLPVLVSKEGLSGLQL